MNVSILKMYFFTSKNARVWDQLLMLLCNMKSWQCCVLVPANAIFKPGKKKGPNFSSRQIYGSLLNSCRFDSASLQMECTVIKHLFFPRHFDNIRYKKTVMLINDKYDCYVLAFCFCSVFAEVTRARHFQELHLFENT